MKFETLATHGFIDLKKQNLEDIKHVKSNKSCN